MKQSRFPKGWDEKRVSELLAHYEPKPKDEIVAEDEATLLGPEQTIMEVPSKLVPTVRELIAKTRGCCLNSLTSRSSRRQTGYAAGPRLSLVVRFQLGKLM